MLGKSDLPCHTPIRFCVQGVHMSFAAAHESKTLRRSCQSCRERKARFRYRGQVRADRDHTLCFECYRSERERGRAAALVDGLHPHPRWAPSNAVRPLNARQIAQRRAMLAHLMG